MKGAALKAWDENVGFFETPEGVKDGDSTLKAFLDLLDMVSVMSLLKMNGHAKTGTSRVGLVGQRSDTKRNEEQLQGGIANQITV